MKINSDTLPVILGSSIMLVVFAIVSGILMSYADSRATQEKQELQDSFAAQKSKEDDTFKASVSSPPPVSGGRGDALESPGVSQELKMGDYSNPPTNITSSGSSTSSSGIDRPLSQRSSSLGSSSLSSRSLTSTQPAPSIGSRNNSFSSGSSSNTGITSESLVTPLEEDDPLGSLDSSSNSISDRDDSEVEVDAFDEESQF